MNEINNERTLSIIKPDAVERNLETKIKNFFTENDLSIINCKKIKISKNGIQSFSHKLHAGSKNWIKKTFQ